MYLTVSGHFIPLGVIIPIQIISAGLKQQNYHQNHRFSEVNLECEDRGEKRHFCGWILWIYIYALSKKIICIVWDPIFWPRLDPGIGITVFLMYLF